MPPDDLLIRRAIVLASVLIYWIGVAVQARRVRRHIGRSPNLKPRGLKERLLWLGWISVVGGWIALAFVIRADHACILLRLQSGLLHPAGLLLGFLLAAGGYAGTLWCYAAMGDHWRIGVDQSEKNPLVTGGPYRFMRHPIYSFQMVMLAGAALLLPSWLPVLLLGLHLLCVFFKALDEEAYLTRKHGDLYRQYMLHTGRLLPAFFRSARGR